MLIMEFTQISNRQVRKFYFLKYEKNMQELLKNTLVNYDIA